jgi:hypothetical protein
MSDSPEQIVREVGKRLAQKRLGKDALVKLLKVISPSPTDSPPGPFPPSIEPSALSFLVKRCTAH